MSRSFGSTLAFMTLLTGLSAQAQSQKALDRLQAADRALATGLTLEVEIRRPADALYSDLGTEIQHGRLTTDGSAMALSTVSSYPEAPVYRAPFDRTDQERNFNDFGDLIVWRKARRDTFANAASNETTDEVVPWTVSPNGTLQTKTQPFVGLQRYDAEDEDNLQDFHYVLMALGRGYSRHLHSILSVAPTTQGRLQIDARGQFGPASLGVWRLNVDPDAGYLVYSASYTPAGAFEPAIVVNSYGPSRGQHPLMASHGTLRFVLDSGQSYTYSVRWLSAAAQSDPALMSEVQERVASSAILGARIWDWRRQDLGRRDGELVDDDIEVVPIDPVPVVTCCACQEVSHRVHECGHFVGDTNANRCSSNWCIDNVIDSATCVSLAANGENKCFQISVPSRPMVIQTAKTMANCPTGGQPVNWGLEMRNYSGCSGCTPTVPDEIHTACKIDSCAGAQILQDFRGAARDCAPGAVVLPELIPVE